MHPVPWASPRPAALSSEAQFCCLMGGEDTGGQCPPAGCPQKSCPTGLCDRDSMETAGLRERTLHIYPGAGGLGSPPLPRTWWGVESSLPRLVLGPDTGRGGMGTQSRASVCPRAAPLLLCSVPWRLARDRSGPGDVGWGRRTWVFALPSTLRGSAHSTRLLAPRSSLPFSPLTPQVRLYRPPDSCADLAALFDLCKRFLITQSTLVARRSC